MKHEKAPTFQNIIVLWNYEEILWINKKLKIKSYRIFTRNNKKANAISKKLIIIYSRIKKSRILGLLPFVNKENL